MMRFTYFTAYLVTISLLLSSQSFAVEIEGLPEEGGPAIAEQQDEDPGQANERPRVLFMSRENFMRLLRRYTHPTVQEQKFIMATTALAVGLGVQNDWRYPGKLEYLPHIFLNAFAITAFENVNSKELKIPLAALSAAISGAVVYPLFSDCIGNSCRYPSLPIGSLMWAELSRRKLLQVGLPDQLLIRTALNSMGTYHTMRFFGSGTINDSDRQFIVLFTSTVVVLAVIQLSRGD